MVLANDVDVVAATAAAAVAAVVVVVVVVVVAAFFSVREGIDDDGGGKEGGGGLRVSLRISRNSVSLLQIWARMKRNSALGSVDSASRRSSMTGLRGVYWM